MAIIIADAGPFIALAKINQLDLLATLFSTVTITQAVSDECLLSPYAYKALIAQAIEKGWLRCVENPVFKHSLSKSLGLGEQSSIEYALQTTDTFLLVMDDALARKQAMRCQLPLVGTAALLFAAQHKKLITDAEAYIAELNKIGYRISATVVAQLKQQKT